MIFYFTATGNCLEIARKLDNKIYSIPLINEQDLTFKDETIGIVCPVYAGKMPNIVTKFIQKATFITDYFYIVETYGMNDSVASKWASDYCNKHNIKVNYANTIKMVDNYLPAFDVSEQMKMDKQVDQQLSLIKEDLKQRKNYIKQPTADGIEKFEAVSQRFKEHPELNNGEQIKITDKCTGCGICTKVCPIKNLKLVDKKAVKINKTCEFCLACANNCPNKAIVMAINEINPNARYRNSNVSLKDIIESNGGM